MTERFRSFADAAEKPVWTPVVNPLPRYESNAEKRRWEDAAEANPIRPGESRSDWCERVSAAARPVIGDRELPPSDREPGEDDG